MTGTPGGAINETFFSQYDSTVQSALSSGSGVYVIVDVVSLPGLVHTYVRSHARLCSITTLASMAVSLVREDLPTISSMTCGHSSPRSTRATPGLLYASLYSPSLSQLTTKSSSVS